MLDQRNCVALHETVAESTPSPEIFRDLGRCQWVGKRDAGLVGKGFDVALDGRMEDEAVRQGGVLVGKAAVARQATGSGRVGRGIGPAGVDQPAN